MEKLSRNVCLGGHRAYRIEKCGSDEDALMREDTRKCVGVGLFIRLTIQQQRPLEDLLVRFPGFIVFDVFDTSIIVYSQLFTG